ncbi:hypothetical protein POM88_025179 [Heracleum sosnowskyi]|uniref:Uncharacterized protein n=1 Tax=Heracleum sosnowskyi TaxID=360622 RepID=A0AAD8MJK3_9APIA|nr:hypothetical protein POM88_025179 [Heracleum sosnowskyi]
MVISMDCSWIWKRVLKLRSMSRQFIIFKLGNGHGISLSFDPWRRDNCLVNHKSDSIISQAGSTPNATVNALIYGGSCQLPTPNPRLHHLHHNFSNWLNMFDFSEFFLTILDSITCAFGSICVKKAWRFIELGNDL